MFAAVTAGEFGLLPRLGGLTHDAAALRRARPAWAAASIVTQAVSLGSYALAVLGYRIVNFWLPLLPGAVAYLRIRLTPGTHSTQDRNERNT